MSENFIETHLQKMVQINSVNPDLSPDGAGEEEISRYIFNVLNELGVETELDEIAPGRFNVTGIIRGGGGGKSLILNAHTDTVGVDGMEQPFSGEIRDGKLYGRGAYDMKGSAAAILDVAEKMRRQKNELRGDVIFSFVADEEYESIGAQEFVKKYRADAAIVTEPTDLHICTAHRGFGVYKITVKGKTAHGGRHQHGIDANAKAGKILALIDEWAQKLPKQRQHPLCGAASVHVPLVSGGRSLFIYSHECTVHIERRTLPGETEGTVASEIHALMNEIAARDDQFLAQMETVIWRSPYEISMKNEIVETLDKAVKSITDHTPKYIGHGWWEDSAIFGQAGIPTVIIGAKGHGIHEIEEWVELDSVKTLSEILYHTALQFCE